MWEQHGKITDETWMGAYRTSAAWEDEMYVQDKAYMHEEGADDDLTVLPCDYNDAIEIAASDEEDDDEDDDEGNDE
eukprot:COSAG06_NODE_281_length_18447_cov_14.060116_4_plen_76_part_00